MIEIGAPNFTVSGPQMALRGPVPDILGKMKKKTAFDNCIWQEMLEAIDNCFLKVYYQMGRLRFWTKKLYLLPVFPLSQVMDHIQPASCRLHRSINFKNGNTPAGEYDTFSTHKY